MSTPEGGLDLAQLAGMMLTAPHLDAALVEVTRVSTRAVSAADGCSITMRSNGVPTAPAADDDWATELDKLQFVEQEGPCVDCLREGIVIRARDLGSDGRFPSYGPRAAELGAVSALSLPLTADGRTVGALNLYAREPGAFGPSELAFGQLLAAHASLAVQAASAYYSSRDLADQMRQALESRAVIDQAKGIVMARTGADADAAFALLVTQSQQSNRKLREVAEQLVRETQSS
jgi:GAF domain-containing protein